MYLSRADIPLNYKNKSTSLKHLSIISFKPKALEKFSKSKKNILREYRGYRITQSFRNRS